MTTTETTPAATGALVAFHGDPELKSRLLVELGRHREADAIVQGQYGGFGVIDEDDVFTANPGGQFRGCDVGCTLHSLGLTTGFDQHSKHPELLGIPTQLAHLFDAMFEALPAATAKDWPIRHTAATPVGADLTVVWPRFAAWMMLDDTWGLVHVAEADDVKAVCRQVGEAYQRIGAGHTLTDEECAVITKAAWAARAARAAWAAWAARDARAARAARDARDAFVAASADKLCELLAATEVPNVDA